MRIETWGAEKLDKKLTESLIHSMNEHEQRDEGNMKKLDKI
jgi:hypothetical protein